MNRKQRRAAAKVAKKQKGLESEITEKMLMFDEMPEECSSCTAAFDREDREMVMSWNVVVREKEKIVRLYCPKCWKAAQRAVAQLYGVVDEFI